MLDDLARVVWNAALTDSPHVARNITRAVVLALADDITAATAHSPGPLEDVGAHFAAVDAACDRLFALIAEAKEPTP